MDLDNLDTSNVTNMNGMFSYCSRLTSLDLSGFDTGNVTNMSNMFRGCSNLATLDVSGFDTSNVTNTTDAIDRQVHAAGALGADESVTFMNNRDTAVPTDGYSVMRFLLPILLIVGCVTGYVSMRRRKR